jgi:hypothetical protein
MSPTDEIAALRRVVDAARNWREAETVDEQTHAYGFLCAALDALPAASPPVVATPAEVEALRRERDEHIRVVEEARYAAVKAKHVAEDEARIARAEVEALRRERDAWQRACEENAADGSRWLNELATLRAANARLREVLEPFAETGDWWDRQYPNSPAHTAFGLVQCPAEESNFTLGDLRAARATLKEPTP